MRDFDSKANVPMPSEYKKMLALCDERINAAAFEQAASIAMTYKNKVLQSHAVGRKQRAIYAGYAWYMMTKASMGILRASPSKRTSDNYKAFFTAHHMGHACFQDALSEGADWNEESEHYWCVQAIQALYDDIYALCGADPALEDADIAAHDLMKR